MTLIELEQNIEEKLAAGFEQQLFRAALLNLGQQANPLRLNNFAYTIRELTRHVLKRLAPDEEVCQCEWFRPESEQPDGITRRQRMIFAIQGGLANRYVTNALGIDAGQIQKRLLDVITNLSKYTHIEPATFEVDQASADEMATDTLTAVLDFLQTIKECRTQVLQPCKSVLIRRWSNMHCQK